MNPDNSRTQLITGILAVQLGFARSEQVLAAMSAWLVNPQETLMAFLERTGALTGRRKGFLEALVQETLRVHGGDAADAFASLGGERVLQHTFSGSLVLSPAGEVQVEESPAAVPGAEAALAEEQPGRYAVRGEQGRGGQARVLLAFDAQIGREIAVKEILGDADTLSAGESSVAVARFLREARITGQLEHPNIVPVHEIGQRPDGSLYYTMRLVRGETLAARLQDCRDLPERLKLLGPFWDLCKAVAFAHSRGVVHRDIKPQNVMVGQFGETVVLDWGLSKIHGKEDMPEQKDRLIAHRQDAGDSAETMAGSALGTPSYMSPEQAEGQVDKIDERSDVWGLGAVLYELLTGRPPFTGEMPYEIIGKVMKDPLQPVAELCPEAPRELSAVAEKALQRNRVLRYQSAAELSEEVEAFMTGGRVRAYEYGTVDLLRRFARRHKKALATGLVGLVLLLVLGVVAYLQVRSERDHARAQRAAAMRFGSLLVGDLFEKMKRLTGSTPVLQAMVTTTLEYMNAHIDPRTGSPRERRLLAVGYRKVSEVALQVGQTDQAHDAATLSVDILEELLADAPRDAGLEIELASSLIGRGDADYKRARYREAAADARRAVEMLEPKVRSAGAANTEQVLLVRGLRLQGDVVRRQEGDPDSRPLRERGLAACLEFVKRNPNDTTLRRELALAYERLGIIRWREANRRPARDLLEKSLEIRQALYRAEPSLAERQRDLVVIYVLLSRLALRDQRLDESRAMFEKALGLSRKLGEIDPANQVYQSDQLTILADLATLAVSEGELQAANRRFEESLEAVRRFARLDPGSMERRFNLLLGLRKAALSSMRLGRLEEALAHSLEGVREGEALVARNPDAEMNLQTLLAALFQTASVAYRLSRDDLSRDMCRRYLELANKSNNLEQSVFMRTAGKSFCRLLAGDLAGFQEVREKALARYPRLSEVAILRVEADVLTRHSARALELGQATLDAGVPDPVDHLMLRVYLAVAQAARGDVTGAKQHILAAQKLLGEVKPDSYWYWDMLPALMQVGQLKSPLGSALVKLFSGLQECIERLDPSRGLKALKAFLPVLPRLRRLGSGPP